MCMHEAAVTWLPALFRVNTYLYLGGPSDLACSCRRTFAVSRGKVAICKKAAPSVSWHSVLDQQFHKLLTSPVQAAIAELTNVAQIGSGLAAGEFAGGDICAESGR